MTKYDIDIDRVHDLVAVRIITGDEKMCYKTLDALHSTFSPLAGRRKDYIAKPKSNGYKSLHTSLKAGNSAVLEVHIRVTEFGTAAYWLYEQVREKQLKSRVNGGNMQKKFSTTGQGALLFSVCPGE